MVLRPPPEGSPIGLWIIFFIILLMAISVIGSWVIACMARGDLNRMMTQGRSAAQAGKVKLAMFLYYISLIITQLFFLVFFIFALVVYSASKQAGAAVSAGVGLLLLIVALLLLPFWLMWLGQLIQRCKLSAALTDIYSGGSKMLV